MQDLLRSEINPERPLYNMGITFAISQGMLDYKISTIFGDDELMLYTLAGVEEFSKPFAFKVDMLSKNPALDIQSALGTEFSLEILADKDNPRYINGIITNFSQGLTITEGDVSKSRQTAQSYTHYTAEVRPNLWLLSLNNEFKIFQEKDVNSIVDEVLENAGIQGVSNNTNSRGNTVRNYCVQYSESDLSFISRLMEDEGIFYFFKHQSGEDSLILGDSTDSYCELGKVGVAQSVHRLSINTIFNARLASNYCSGMASVTDYNYNTSQTDLLNSTSGKNSVHDMFEYPGKFEKSDEGQGIADIRLQLLEQNEKTLIAESCMPGFAPGYVFTLENHPSESFNGDYVICKVEHFIDITSKDAIYRNKIVAIEADKAFRPKRVTAKPKIWGSQTAVVTGPDGEEIYRDELGRIKVHFFWDRYGEYNENSSCWIRVAQLWAGNAWGGLYIPRIGQEVVVNFENGDPDHPLIVGCVYNDQLTPPYEEGTKSTIKSASSKEEEGFNEIRFEDLKDEEEIYVHAQKDLNVEVINQRHVTIQEGDDILDILAGSRTTSLNAEGDNPGNYTTTLTKGDMTTTLEEGNCSTTLVKGDMSTVLNEGNRSVTLDKGNHSTTLSEGNMDLSITGDYSITVDGNLTISVTGDITISADKGISITSTEDTVVTSSQNLSMEASMEVGCKSGTDSNFESGTNFTAKAGVNFATEAGVAFDIKGVTVAVKGDATTDINSPMITVGGGMVQLG